MRVLRECAGGPRSRLVCIGQLHLNLRSRSAQPLPSSGRFSETLSSIGRDSQALRRREIGSVMNPNTYAGKVNCSTQNFTTRAREPFSRLLSLPNMDPHIATFLRSCQQEGIKRTAIGSYLASCILMHAYLPAASAFIFTNYSGPNKLSHERGKIKLYQEFSCGSDDCFIAHKQSVD